MTEWSVLADLATVSAPQGDTAAAVAAILDASSPSIAIGDHLVSVRIAVTAPDALSAIGAGTGTVLLAYRAATNEDATIVHTEATEWDRFAADLEAPNFPDLLGVTELADILGVTRQRAHAIAARDDFPDPVERLASGPIWTEPSVRAFLTTWERKPGRPATVRPHTFHGGATDLDWSKLLATTGATMPTSVAVAALAGLVVAGILTWRDRRTSALTITDTIPSDADLDEGYAKVINIVERIANKNHGAVPIDAFAHELGVDAPAGEIRKQLSTEITRATT